MSAIVALPTLLLDTLLAPTSALAAVPTRRPFGPVALALVLLLPALGQWAFLGAMSSEWLVAQQLADVALPPNQLSEVRKELEAIAPSLPALAALQRLLGLVALALLAGSVLFLAERILASSRRRPAVWLAAAAVGALPLALEGVGLIAVALLSQAPDQPLHRAHYASVAALFPAASDWPGWLAGVSLFEIWTACLWALAFRVLSGHGGWRAALAGGLPLGIVVAVRALT